jgi:hypothetical protein
VLRACIPGCETIERTSDTEYQVTMTARVGPVNAKFRGRLSLADLVPPQSYMLRFEGQGGAAGFANGTARVALAPAEAGTRVDYAVSAQVGGKLAQIGSRLIDGVAAKLADDFFTRFGERASAEPTAEAEAAGAPPAQLATALHTMRTRLLLAAVIVAAIAIYWWLHSA